MNRRDRVANELGMLCGTYSNDIDYLVFLALKGGEYNPEGYVNKPQEVREEDKLGVQSFEDWFNSV